MLLLKIANKSFFSHNLTIYNRTKYLHFIVNILDFAKSEIFSFYTRWMLLFIFANLYNLRVKTNYFVSYIYSSYLNNQKLVSYVISINSFSTNTIINVNDIKGNPKFFYSAGMLNLQKNQKIRQPKAIITILRALLVKSKIFKANFTLLVCSFPIK
jgi:hypothetical protein